MLESMNLAILIGSVLVVVAAFTSLISFRFGAPLLLVFLLLGLLAGEDGIAGIAFDNAGAAYLHRRPRAGRHPVRFGLRDAGRDPRIAAAPAAGPVDGGRRGDGGPGRPRRAVALRISMAGGACCSAPSSRRPTRRRSSSSSGSAASRSAIASARRWRSNPAPTIRSRSSSPCRWSKWWSMPASPGSLSLELVGRFVLQIGIGGVAGARRRLRHRAGRQPHAASRRRSIRSSSSPRRWRPSPSPA